MKRSTVVAAVAVAAVIGGGTVAGAAMSGGSEPSAAAQELRAEASSQDSPPPGGATSAEDRDDRDDRDDTGRDAGKDAGENTGEQADRAAAGVADQVIRTALEAVPGHVVELDLDREDKHWDVEVAGEDNREHELEISLDGGKVLHHERDSDDAREKVRLLSGGSVSAADAVRIAEERVAGQVEDLDLDADDRVWDVELRTGDGSVWELEVDLGSGDVRNVERDDDRDDD
ncbi:PepSY domain-containing protein [Streptomyces bohaiensis]|uniref:PepSY domain-containing protein n=1 Tax=Streptomyces bohaiensis TaxID=1431344 RepID=UPI003B769E6A